MSEKIKINETVALIDSSNRTYLLLIEDRTDKFKGIGIINPKNLVGKQYGKECEIGNKKFWLFKPSLQDKLLGIKRKAQIILPKDSAHIIMNCSIINCAAIGGDGGYGQAGQDGQDGQGGQAGQEGQEGQAASEPLNDGEPAAGGNGGAGGDGGVGGNGGRGGDGGKGGDGGEALGGAIFFGPNCNPTIRSLKIINCFTRQGLGNYGGDGGAGGAGGAGAAPGEGGIGPVASCERRSRTRPCGRGRPPPGRVSARRPCVARVRAGRGRRAAPRSWLGCCRSGWAVVHSPARVAVARPRCSRVV